MTDLTRRSFLKGIGAISVTLLFRQRLDAALASLENELALQPITPWQLPTAADIVVTPQQPFRPWRIIASPEAAHLFVIERIAVGDVDQLACAIPADVFRPEQIDSAIVMSTAGPAAPLRFRVRYVGTSRDGAKFTGAIFGVTSERSHDARGRRPIGMSVIPLQSIQLGA